ncbi:MAG: TetR family transcriptional regulator [Pseudomonadales bacterium]|jgi:DNA-binding transcriptional regulator YbjK|uniref:TetR/AcrR family transcriptional regulator n=1 Tax=unclassified Ketobacter TaxID=2639109 RepID=UPI000C462C0E|nr:MULTISPECIES: TetR family transcriptional regulator [unclassified Ketobacter]MAA60457.1 TetR family transcriptional regulator [Pseudomonadales bacterium]TNC89588.1 MAG: TetR family transcriptional regulator [Alcanivorax sp.]HAG97001.1 TetR family transcriptional regulator [Gammaproteobacteria bacterium]MAQ27174.1 TetR family transcriptional regulator [Pseudomonadales bacterium]MBI27007.1 TetR family transcriptional regulator [Pseudomonadales bacterium]|tara:strand:+ start:43592 stop:44263 length:672 start_codon:yes stop_codon:yes gene_type:complete
MSDENAINYRGRKASRARSEQRRKAILEAALRIVVNDGVRGVRHRAVAKEAEVPLSATTYYFKDISDLIADTFTLFAENAMNDVVQPIYQHVGEFIEQHKADVGASPEVTNQLLQNLSQMIVSYMKLELTDKRDHMIAEQAFKHECLRDARLRSIAQTYFDHLLEEMVELCKVIGVEDPEIAGELLMGTIFRIEHEALMIPVAQFDEDKACRMIRRQLSAFLP